MSAPKFREWLLGDAPEREAARALADRGREDLLLIGAAVQLPPLAGIRLAWSAYRVDGTAAVSPVIESADVYEAGRTDAACLHVSGFLHPEMDLPGATDSTCVYLRRDALDLIGRERTLARLEDFFAGARRLRLSTRQADHVFATGAVAALPALPDLAARIRLALAGAGEFPDAAAAVRPRQLHVLHGWGGGADTWVRNFRRFDPGNDNFILRAESRPGVAGTHLSLFGPGSDAAMEVWPLDPVIPATALTHEGYKAVLAGVVERYGIDRILVSSLIGHSLDVLRTGLSTVMICHDYYPFCPALNITFGTVCAKCGEAELGACSAENPLNRHFPNVPCSHWTRLRQAFALELGRGVTMIAPSPSVREHYERLFPAAAGRFRLLPHGSPPLDVKLIRPGTDAGRRLRVLVPGRIQEAKGAALAVRALPAIAEFADVIALGCGDSAGFLEKTPNVTMIRHYRWEDLPSILAEISPDAALLLSVAPETFSFTLQEMHAFGIPPVATRIGAFADRIQDGVNGFLVDLDAEAIAARLRTLASDRRSLERVHEAIRHAAVRPIGDMLRDYETLELSPRISERAYFRRRSGSHFTECRLYWAAVGESLSHDRSASAPVRFDAERQRVRIAFPRLEPGPGQLRLDIASRPGFLNLIRMAVFDGDGNSVWVWSGDAEELARHGANQLVSLGAAPGEGALRMFMTGDDPYVRLPLERRHLEALGGGGVVEVELRYPDGAEVASQLAAEIQEYRGLLAARESQVAEYRVQHEKTAALHHVHAQRLIDAMERMKMEMDALSADRARAAAAEARAQSAAAAAEERLREMYASLSWRVTGPLRRLASVVRWLQ